MTRLLVFALLGILTASGQTGGTTPKPGAGTPSPTPSPSPTRSPTPGSTQQTTDSTLSRTVFISGKVVMEDGTPPPESVVIERSCGSTRRAETRTDLKGHFNFQVGGGAVNTEQIMDVSNDSMSNRMPGQASGGLSPLGSAGGGRLDSMTNLRGCDLRALLPGYQSSAVNLSMHSQFDSPDIGMIILKRMAGREGDTISMTNALAPKDAKKAYDKSRQLMAKGDMTGAQRELSKAVDIYPKYASAWAELGRIQMDGNDPAGARKSFEKSVEADGKYLPPYERLAVLALRERNWEDLVEKTDKLIKLNAYDFPQAYYYNALGNLNLNHADLADKSARLALKQDPQKFARAYYILGLALAAKGEFANAAEQIKSYLTSGPVGNETDVVRKQLADIEKLATQQTAAKEPQP